MTSSNGNNGSANKGPSSLQELVLAKKAALEAQLRALDTLDIDKLLQEREETAVRLAELDNQIKQVRVQLGVEETHAGGGSGNGHSRGLESGRSRMSSEEVRSRVLRVLHEEKSGLSQLQIAERASLAYGTVAAYLKANAANFKTLGQLKSKRYFLK